MIVYCVSSRPNGTTRNQYMAELLDPSEYPELLNRSVNT